MNLEITTITAGGLEAATYGVNYQLQFVKTDDSLGHDDPRLVKGVLHPYRDDEANRGRLGTDSPLLIVSRPERYGMQGEPTTGIADTDAFGVTVSIGIVTEMDSIRTARGQSEISYLGRAIVRALRTLALNDNSDDRLMNGIQVRQLLDCQSVAIPNVIVFEDLKGFGVAGGVIVRWEVRDLEVIS